MRAGLCGLSRARGFKRQPLALHPIPALKLRAFGSFSRKQICSRNT